MCLLILERGEGREGGREKETDRQTGIDWLPLTGTLTLTGDRTTTSACALTGNQTHDLLVWGARLQLSHIGLGFSRSWKTNKIWVGGQEETVFKV